MNARSITALSLVDPRLASIVTAAARGLALRGMEILVVSGLRTAVEQNALYAQGRTAPGHVVTNARAGQSMHNYGLAVDIVPYLTTDCTELNWKSDTAQYQTMVAELKDAGLEWGGDWKGDLGDFDHFQMPGLPASPSPAMVADYATWGKDCGTVADPASVGLQQIWNYAADGQYKPAEG